MGLLNLGTYRPASEKVMFGRVRNTGRTYKLCGAMRMRQIEMSLPWPNKSLSPNARVHRMARAKLVKVQRKQATYLALEAGAKRLRGAPKMSVDLTMCPPDRRRRDWDNVIGSLKGAFDGLADASGVDDSLWRVSWEWGEPIKGGEIKVTMRT